VTGVAIRKAMDAYASLVVDGEEMTPREHCKVVIAVVVGAQSSPLMVVPDRVLRFVSPKAAPDAIVKFWRTRNGREWIAKIAIIDGVKPERTIELLP
jgi:hypothetical protein